MRTKAFILVAVAVFAALVGGFVYVALSGGGDERRVGALRSYAGASFAVTLDGANVGSVKSVSGCGVSAPPSGTGIEKQAGPVEYGACKVTFALAGMGQGLSKWITDSLAGNVAPRNVSILQGDVNQNVVNELVLQDTRLTKFTVPQLDAASNSPLTFEVWLQPQSIRKQKGGGKLGAAVGAAQKNVIASNFRLTIPGIADTKNVGKVESWSFTVALSASAAEKGSAGRVELGELGLFVAEPAADFDVWLNDLINGKPNEKPVTLELLDTSGKNVLELGLSGAGISEGEFLGATEASGTVAQRRFLLYVKGATIKFS